jgi:hypothetical protein
MNPGTVPGFGPGTVQQTGVRRQLAILSSRNYVIQYSGVYLVYCIGAGGSGAYNSGPVYLRATGGGAGGLAVKQIFLPAKTVLTVTIGAGGAAKTVVGNGNAGGTTSVYGSGLALYATGGSGGTQDSTTATGTISGAAGGVGSGGDWNFPGGASGSAIITGTLAATRSWAYTGGGAVAFLGTAYSGGTATADSTSAAANVFSYSGGAGVGGNGGASSATVGGTARGGAGAWYAAGNAGNDGNGTATSYIGSPFGIGNNTSGVDAILANWDYLVPYGIGQAASSSTQSTGYGNGSAFATPSSPNTILGGSGATSGTSGTAFMGGGSGAAGTASGAGGDGAVILTWVQ